MKQEFEQWLLKFYDDVIEFYNLPEYFRNLIKIAWINTLPDSYILLNQRKGIFGYVGKVHFGETIIFDEETPEQLAAGAIQRYEQMIHKLQKEAS